MANSKSGLSIPSTASATGSTGRNKVALKPGRSLMDWIRLTKSDQDLSGTGGKYFEITARELSKHNKTNDAWIAVKGKVYNVTNYLEFHPGGEDELMRGIGKDATKLFNEVHQWVNIESMLEKCFVGVYKKSWSLRSPKMPNIKQLKLTDDIEITDIAKNIEEPMKVDSAKLGVSDRGLWSIVRNWDSDPKSLSLRLDEDRNWLKLIFESTNTMKRGLITDLVLKHLFIKTSDVNASIIDISLPTRFKDTYKVESHEDKSISVSLAFQDFVSIHKNFLIKDDVTWILCEPKVEFVYWPCKLVGKTPVTHDTFLFTFLLPVSTKMWIPIGHHIQMRSHYDGTEITRSYTPVNLLCDTTSDILDDRKLLLMIKLYSTGLMSQIVARCNLGDSVYISNYIGNLSEDHLKSCDSITLLAAGTGITPMFRIIQWTIENTDKDRTLNLLFFNKTEEDILWREELEKTASCYDKFQVHFILSSPSETWCGLTGYVRTELITKCVPSTKTETCHRVFICGPIPFTQQSKMCLEAEGYTKDDIYVFSGEEK